MSGDIYWVHPSHIARKRSIVEQGETRSGMSYHMLNLD